MQDLKAMKEMLDKLLYILNKRQRLAMVGMTFIILIGSLFELLGVSAMLPFIQALMTPEELMNKPYISFFLSPLGVTDPKIAIYYVGGGIILVYLVKNIYLLFSGYMQTRYNIKFLRSISTQMFRAYMARPYEYFAQTNSAEITQGVVIDPSGVETIVETLFKFIAETLTVILLAAYLIYTDPAMAAGLLLIGAFCVIVITLSFKKTISRYSVDERNANLAIKKSVLEASNGVKDVFVFNKREYFLNQFDHSYDSKEKANIGYKFIGLCPERLIESLCVGGILLTVLLRIRSGVDVATFVPELAVFAVAAFRLLPCISRISGYIATFLFARPSLNATYENIKAAREYMAAQDEIVDESVEKKNLEEEVRIDDITFMYSDGDENVLDGLSLTIRKGESVGLIGESGAGKSTLADILLRLYPVNKGSITVDGIDIYSIPRQWSGIISYVPQQVFLMDDTIRRNVAFGEEEIDEDRVWETLEQAHLSDFVRSLPKGLDTIVGERGVRFSGGQCQRIAIARALYRNPDIIVLDEATSALDNETEEAVMEAIDALQGDKTLIIIAHRLSTIANCDHIYEIGGGLARERSKDEVLS